MTRISSLEDVHLRPQVAHDMPWLRDLYASTRVEELASVPWPESVKRAFLDQQFELQRTHFETFYGAARFLAIIDEQAQPVGRYIILESDPEHLIVDIALFPHRRGEGIGSALIQSSLQTAASRNSATALHVLKHNAAAVRLYQRLGFKVSANDGSHWRMRWTPEDHLDAPKLALV